MVFMAVLKQEASEPRPIAPSHPPHVHQLLSVSSFLLLLSVFTVLGHAFLTLARTGPGDPCLTDPAGSALP